MVLPFLDERDAYVNYNFRVASCAPHNATAGTMALQCYVCPANPRGDRLIASAYDSGARAPIDYALSAGANALLTPVSPFGENATNGHGFPPQYRPGVGIFNVNSSVNNRRIIDGAAKTMLVGEAAGGPMVGHGLPVFGGGATTAPNLDAHVDVSWSQGYLHSARWITARDNGEEKSRLWSSGGFGSVFAVSAFDAWHRDGTLAPADDPAKGWTAQPINENGLRHIRGTSYSQSFSDGIDLAGKDGAPTAMPDLSVSGFRSFHEAGCHVAFADGAIVFISEKIDPRVMVAYGSIAGMESFVIRNPP
jgi:hypothetical protein